MKKIIGFLVLFCLTLFSLSCTAFCDDSVILNSDYFPDSTFREYIASELGKSEGDTLSQEDLDKLTRIDIEDTEVTSLKGIEYFTKLTGLNCTNTKISEFDLSNNTALEIFSCENTAISELDISNNPALKYLFCDNTGISKLDITNNHNLIYLFCDDTGISKLDVSNNPFLDTISCDNTGISELDVSNNTALKILHCDNTGVSKLDISNNIVLITLSCDNTAVSELDVSNNTMLKYLYCSGTGVSELDVSNNTALIELSCKNTAISKLDLSNNTDLQVINCDNTGISELDVSNISYLKYLYCSDTRLKALDLSKNTFLKDFLGSGNIEEAVEFDGEKLFSIDLSKVVPDITKISEVKGGSYDKVTGIVAFDAKNTPEAFTYKYLIGNGDYALSVKVKLIKEKELLTENSFVIVPVTDFVYDGKVKSITVTTALTDVGEYTVDFADAIKAGSYRAVVNVKGNDKYYPVKLSWPITIAKRAVEIEWLGENTFEFDNTVKKVSAVCKNIIEGDTVSLIFDGVTEAIEAGEYTAYVMGIDNDDYVISDCAITIKKWSITKSENPAEYNFMLGDVNLDGEITTKDATEIISEILRKNTDKYITNDTDYLKIADVNGDGELTPKDATEIIKDVLKSEADKVLKNTIITVSKDLKATNK